MALGIEESQRFWESLGAQPAGACPALPRCSRARELWDCHTPCPSEAEAAGGSSGNAADWQLLPASPTEDEEAPIISNSFHSRYRRALLAQPGHSALVAIRVLSPLARC